MHITRGEPSTVNVNCELSTPVGGRPAIARSQFDVHRRPVSGRPQADRDPPAAVPVPLIHSYNVSY